jgi:two-component system, NtrC family, response regulator AtoC
MINKRILIIDDDVELCEELADILISEGHTVTWTSDNDQWPALINNLIFDIIILDYKMTGITGIEILEYMKDKGIKTGVIMISGRPFVEKLIEDKALSSFILGIIKKPIDLKALLEKIQAA